MKCVLVSGASGAVGSALAPLFLQEKDTEVRLILRANGRTHLQQRLTSLLNFWELDGAKATRIQPLQGDVTLPRWGVSDKEFRGLTEQVTHIVHSAGNVRLNQPLAEARRNAVDSARHVLEVARACQNNGQFQKLEFLSTVGVAGKTTGLVEERPFHEPRAFRNSYEAAKAEAENLVVAEIAAGLPATIHRPSMVVGDSVSGKVIHFQVFYYLSDFLAGLKTRGVIPETGDAKLDLIPVDYVAKVIHRASGRLETAGKIFHLCSGPEHTLKLCDLTRRLREMLCQRGKRLPTSRRIPLGLFRRSALLVSPFVRRKTRRLLRSLPFFIDYLAENQTFDNHGTNSFFSATGLEAPRADDYLHVIMEAYWNQQKS